MVEYFLCFLFIRMPTQLERSCIAFTDDRFNKPLPSAVLFSNKIWSGGKSICILIHHSSHCTNLSNPKFMHLPRGETHLVIQKGQTLDGHFLKSMGMYRDALKLLNRIDFTHLYSMFVIPNWSRKIAKNRESTLNEAAQCMRFCMVYVSYHWLSIRF